MTRMRWLTQWLVVGCVLLAPAVAGAATIERFTPQGPVKEVRQAVAVFSAPMVPFGDLRAVAPPFSVQCPVAGSGRWVDPRTWAFDFEKDLPGGIACSFTLAPGLKDRAGKPVTGQLRFDFTTGGPAIESSRPGDGDERIDAQQAFVLELDGEATPESVAQHAAFEVEGLAQRVGVELIATPEREQIVAGLPYWLKPSGPYVVLRARQTFPDATKIRLVWGAGIVSPAGVATDSEQVLEFATRPKFGVEVSCQRENAKADCIPLTAINLRFSAPVAWAQASAVRLTSADGTARAPVEPDDPSDSVTYLEFAPPFPPSATFTVTLPADLHDDAGRSLTSDAPLTAKTAPFPPLAKFAARFGLLESHAEPALPVTIRNLDPDTKGRQLRTTAERPTEWRAKLSDLYARLTGSSVRVDQPEELLPWLRRLAEAKRDRSIFDDLPAGNTPSGFTLPQPDGAQTMQVVGLPLPAPGFYLVELTSPRLGDSLMDGAGPMYVPAGALVTNLAVHLKWARENALVWVTTLDDAEPVAGARVAVQQCDGSVVGTGVTDAQGIARFSGLPEPDEAKSCPSPELKDFTGIDYYEYYQNRALTSLNSGLFVTAQTSGDLSFVHSSWDQGIESWRFNLPSEGYDAPLLAHTIFDRSLFRAGETVHMKYVLRSQTLAGFGAVPDADRPAKAVVRHLATNDRFELPISWDANGMAEATWQIPAAAKLGAYDVQLVKSDDDTLDAGGFRVEQFRVPLMKGTVQLPATPLVGATSAPVDVAVQYLAGGPAADQPVVVRAQVRDRRLPENEAFENFIFANGPVEVGVERSSDSDESEESDEQTAPAVKQKRDLVLDAAGTARTEITDLPLLTTPRELLVEAEYRDPNGETQTAAATAALWPAGLIPGIEVKRWVGGDEEEKSAGKSPPTPLLQRGETPAASSQPGESSIEARVVVLDTSLKPVAGARVQLDAFTRRTFSHRKRLVGGFYTYEHVEETAAAGELCHGQTDAQGIFTCRAAAPARGEIVVQATVKDPDERPASAYASAYIPGDDELGFSVKASDRIDVLPERREVEPGDTARLQVRMPFQAATALVTVEREGIG
ncbi:MAG: MG2 domain-containing protein, partial [Deltaproteobacteria bacterium]|nr:MG2 domain-containing protein [Deltaproteobacteria bacterium]